MYAQEGFMLPFMQGFPQGSVPEIQNSFMFPAEDDLIYTCLPTTALDLDNIIQMPTISEYDLGGGDLFRVLDDLGGGDLIRAPEPILGDPMLALDPVSVSMSMMSDETIEAINLSSLPDEDLLSEVFYECKRELIAVSAILEPWPPEPSEVDAAAAAATVQSKENTVAADSLFALEGPLQKRVSFGCRNSANPGNGGDVGPKFLGFHQLDLENTDGMRRSYSEGDIKILGGNCSVFGDTKMNPSFKLLSAFGDIKIESKIEERRQKIFRYQKKRTKRNFGRKIKYACRKALADSQPRIRGRFARTEDWHVKTEEHEVGKQ